MGPVLWVATEPHYSEEDRAAFTGILTPLLRSRLARKLGSSYVAPADYLTKALGDSLLARLTTEMEREGTLGPDCLAAVQSALAEIFEVDPLVCPQCGVQMRPVAVSREVKVVDRILGHLWRVGGNDPWEGTAQRGPPVPPVTTQRRGFTGGRVGRSTRVEQPERRAMGGSGGVGRIESTIRPAVGAGWVSYEWDIPSDFVGGYGELPPNWSGGNWAAPNTFPADMTSQDMMANVGRIEIRFLYLDYLAAFEPYVMGTDNVTLYYYNGAVRANESSISSMKSMFH